MAMFKVLVGFHSEGERHPVTNKLINYGPGDVFSSNKDLYALHNSPGSLKFERMPDGTPPTHKFPDPVSKAAEDGFRTLTESNKPIVPDNSFDLKRLQSMDVPALIKLAQEEEIDLGNLKKKDEIIAQIQKSLTSPVTA